MRKESQGKGGSDSRKEKTLVRELKGLQAQPEMQQAFVQPVPEMCLGTVCITHILSTEDCISTQEWQEGKMKGRYRA